MQQDIYAAGSKNHPPMLNKENYVPWSSRLLRQYVGQNVGNLNGYNVVQNIGNQNLNGNGNLVAAHAEGNTGHNGNQIRMKKQESNSKLFDLMAAAANLDEIEKVNANCILMANQQQASTSSTQTNKAPVYDSDGSAEYTELLEPILESHQVPQIDNNVISEVTSVEQNGETVEQHPANVEETRALYDSLYQNLAIEVEKVNTVNRKLKETNAKLTTELARFKNQKKCFEISQENMTNLKDVIRNKFVRDFKSLAKEADESLAKHKALELEIERLLRAVVSQDIMSVMQKLLLLIHQISKLSLNENKHGTSANTKFLKQSIVGNLPKVGETHALSKPVTSNLVPTPQESKVMKNDKVIAPGMFRINPVKPYREEKHVPNNVRASVRPKPITVSQLPVFTKKDVNSDSNGLSSSGINNTKTRRPQPRSNTKMIGSPLHLQVVVTRIRELK
nr:hypothetical protein [Tanacetum cinerariifolium]